MTPPGNGHPNNLHTTHNSGTTIMSQPTLPVAGLQTSLPNSTIGNTRNHRLLIHSLPVELLTLIFRLLIDEETWVLPSTNLYPAITLCAVCSYWRRIVVNNTMFWTYISIQNTAQSRKVASLGLERSQDNLVDVSVILGNGCSIYAQEVLSLHSHRIRSLRLSSMCIGSFCGMLRSMLSNGVPKHLKHLELSIKTTPHRLRPHMVPINSILSRSFEIDQFRTLIRQLHTIHLDGISVRSEFYSLNSLHQGFWDCAFPIDLATLLAPDSRVESIEIHNLVRERFGASHVITTNTRNLKRLSLKTVDSTALYSALSSVSPGSYDMDLSVPARFALSSRHNDTPPIPSSSIPDPRSTGLLGSLLRKFNNITKLTLTSGITTTPSQTRCENMRTLLKSLYNLRYLGLVKFHLTQQIVIAMTRTYELESNATSSNTFAMLRELRLQDACILDHDAFKTMVFSHSINYLYLYHCSFKQDGDSLASYPNSSSPLYRWLSAVVPRVEIEHDSIPASEQR
ncbi:hypothetical protein RhiXN_02081 [Rhizoctonia solani]|uniref:F-box domain-containing protein n=1 Tax=Rhizoctonia solani TaxID=456999 RepID=A0A8H8PCB3_9AGAM|nr:uncharacterized protein RhiXN_02081 [Rhizoctonia solani]QRW27486.1 hypothetical protein RhiXN_02081 [Rhizoctonia solani]